MSSGHDILVTGGSGQLGTELSRLRWPSPLKLWLPLRDELDLAQPYKIAEALKNRELAAIVNAGAYTAVDKAEEDPITAFAVNALGPAALAREAHRRNIPLIHISTDYVFDGQKDGFYEEADPVAPLGVYGASKEAGEQAVRTICARAVIVRTSWVVSPYGHNFLKTVLRLATERTSVKIVADQKGCPTAARDLAQAVQTVTHLMMEDARAPTGTFHFVNDGATTWHGLAEAIVQRATHHGRAATAVDAIATAEYPKPAPRPKNSRLSSDRFRKSYGLRPRPWREAVADIVDLLMRNGALQ